MKILAPLHSVEEVEPLSTGGADEFFCGFFPRRWYERWGRGAWPNRRGPGSANLDDVERIGPIVDAAAARGRPVHLTLNAPFHTDAQTDFLLGEAARAAALGVSAFIVTDPGLILRLREALPGVAVFASTVAVATNAEACLFLQELGCSRVILSRHLSLAEIAGLRAAAPDVELEAFILNDNCWFEEGFCATTHSLPGFGVYCLTPWTYELQDNDGSPITDPQRLAQWDFVVDEHRALLGTLSARGSGSGRVGMPLGPCGLCAIPELMDLRINSVKIVGREASLFRKLRSVQAVRHVRDTHVEHGDARRTKAAAISVREDHDGCAEGYGCYYRSARDRTLIPLPGRRPSPRL